MKPLQAGQLTQCGLRAGPLTNIPPLLREFGCDPDAVLADCGFASEQFEDTETVVSYLDASKLLAHCAEVTACSHFGLKLGERCQPSHLGIAGFLVVTAENVLAGLEVLGKYLGLHDQGGSMTLDRSDEYVVMGYVIHQQHAFAPDQIYDLSVVYSCSIMRALCKPDWAPLEVLLSRDKPSDTTPYQRFFRAPIRFNADENAIVFRARWLDQKPPFADPFLHAFLENQAHQEQVVLHDDVVAHLRYVLNQCIATREFTVAAVARRLGLHERTLNRRLKSEGTSFRAELDRVRCGISEQLLSVSSMEIRRIAEVLGYGSTSAFNHAFRRWHQESPEAWRSQNSTK